MRQKLDSSLLELIQIVKRRLTLLERNLICTLLILNVHFREVLDQLVINNTTQVSEFSWIK
jgi:dynein heavy chain